PPLSIGLGAAFVNEHLWQVDFLAPSDHDEIDRKAFAVAGDALASIWCDPSHPGVYPFWRHGIFVDIVTQELLHGSGGFAFTPGLATFPGRVLFVGSDCGPLRADWQIQHNLPLFPRA